MEDPVVELQTGLVRGVVKKHQDGFNYYAFRGVPYAEPPIGELRFKDPIPKKKWSGILDCKNYGHPGVQHDEFLDKDYYSEDCLNLNVYTRWVNESTANNPVLMWGHGGDFNFGAADFSGPDYLIRKNIVLVTVNYRMGVLGFLNLKDEIAPGNQGLNDQAMALRWINENIEMFGGNRNNVTLGGISAGAVSAHYLALSPLSKGFIHKIICMGCCLFNPWVYVKNPKSIAINMCSFLGKKLEDSQEIVNFLRTIDTKQLIKAQQYVRKTVNSLPFGPDIDTIMTIAIQGLQIPCIIGYANRAGQLFLYDKLSFKDISRRDFFDMCNQDFKKVCFYNFTDILNRYNLNEKQFRRMYYKSDEVSETNLESYVDLTTDLNFLEGIHRFAKVQVRQSSALTYLYRFDYESARSMKSLLSLNELKGANHLDELSFTFKLTDIFEDQLKPLTKGTQDYRIMEQMTEMIVNFATYGRPTVEISDLIPVHWKPNAGETILRHMTIDGDLTMQHTVNVEHKFMSAANIKA